MVDWQPTDLGRKFRYEKEYSSDSLLAPNTVINYELWYSADTSGQLVSSNFLLESSTAVKYSNKHIQQNE